jgi:hypothetical protein
LLLLDVLLGGARSLRVNLPAGGRLERVRVDGQATSLTADAGGFDVPLPAPTPGRTATSVAIEYAQSEPTLTSSTLVREVRARAPQFSMPCLALTWQVDTVNPASVVERDPALVETRPQPPPPGPAALINPLGRSSWVESPASLLPSHRAELDQRIGRPGRDGMTLAELLVRWDAGTTPVVVDRMALLGGRWSPRTRLLFDSGTAAATGPNRAPPISIVDSLRSIGLEAVSLGPKAVLLTTRAECPRASEVSTWAAAAATVTNQGTDAQGRLMGAVRWVLTDTSVHPSAVPSRSQPQNV